MDLIVKFELDESWEAYHPNDEERLKALIKSQLEGVKATIIKSKESWKHQY